MAVSLMGIDERGIMIVDTALLRCGADFSQSAGSIIQGAADEFASTHARSTVFGDFDSATDFQRAIVSLRDRKVASMNAHRSTLDSLAEKSRLAASVFDDEDKAGGESIRAASV